MGRPMDVAGLNVKCAEPFITEGREWALVIGGAAAVEELE